MGLVTTVTIGADTFSVYAFTNLAAVADATAYFNGQLGASAAAWTAATADNKARALVSAARWMDRALKYSGTETVPGQPLAWPRNGALECGVAVPDGTVPDAIVLTEFELAGLLLQNAALSSGTGTGSNVKRAKAGSAEVEFFSSTVGTGLDTKVPQPAWDLVKCFTVGAVSGAGIGLASGTDVDSSFCPCDDECTEGFS